MIYKKVFLTERQNSVLRLIAEGHTNGEIANELFMSKRTVEGNRAILITITNTRNTASLITYCFRSGLLV